MNTFHSLDFFEQSIVEHISELTKSEDALKIFMLYKPVFDRFRSYHKNPDEYAELFIEAYESGYTPEMWHQKIDSMRRRYARVIEINNDDKFIVKFNLNNADTSDTSYKDVACSLDINYIK